MGRILFRKMKFETTRMILNNTYNCKVETKSLKYSSGILKIPGFSGDIFQDCKEAEVSGINPCAFDIPAGSSLKNSRVLVPAQTRCCDIAKT